MRYYRPWVLLCLAALSCAFENIAIQDTVQAGIDTQGTIANDLGKEDQSFDAGFTHYRIYLAVTPPGSETGPSCILVNNTAIDKTTFTVNIPTDVGPDGDYYSLATTEFSSDSEEGAGSGYQYSNPIKLQGASGIWSKTELDGNAFIDPDTVLCTGYACARSCADKHYPGNQGDNESDWIATAKCMNECDGVVPMDLASFGSSNETSSAASATDSVSTSKPSSEASSSSTTSSQEGRSGSASGTAASAGSTGGGTTLKASLGGLIVVITCAIFSV